LIEKFFEGVELILPEDAIEREPVGGRLHGSDGKPAHADTAYLFLRDEAGLLEYAQMFQDGRHGDFVGTGEFGDRGLASLERSQNAAARCVSERGKG